MKQIIIWIVCVHYIILDIIDISCQNVRNKIFYSIIIIITIAFVAISFVMFYVTFCDSNVILSNFRIDF